MDVLEYKRPSYQNPTNRLTLREAFHLFEFDIQEFEESLLLLGADDDSDQLVRQLEVKLLQGCLPMYRKRITPQVEKTFLQRRVLRIGLQIYCFRITANT